MAVLSWEELRPGGRRLGWEEAGQAVTFALTPAEARQAAGTRAGLTGRRGGAWRTGGGRPPSGGVCAPRSERPWESARLPVTLTVIHPLPSSPGSQGPSLTPRGTLHCHTTGCADGGPGGEAPGWGGAYVGGREGCLMSCIGLKSGLRRNNVWVLLWLLVVH